MYEAIEVEQKTAKNGKPYWRVRTSEGWSSSFAAVEVGTKGDLVKKGQFTNFIPGVYPAGSASITSEAPKHVASDLNEMNEKLDRILEILEKDNDAPY